MDNLMMELSESLEDITGVSPKSIRKSPSLGTMSAYDPKKDEILISAKLFDKLSKRSTASNHLDFIFALAHEWRHCFQYKKNPNIICGYKDRSQFDNVDDYNMQLAEIDANAFAWRYIDLFTEGAIKPRFDGLSEKIKEIIKKRFIEIGEKENEKES